MPGPKPGALPLGDAPLTSEQEYNIMSKKTCQILFTDFTSFNTEVTAYISLFATSSMYS